MLLITQSLSCIQFCDTMDCSMPGFAPLLSPRVFSNSCPLSQKYHPTISSSVIPLSPPLNLSQHQDLFKWVSSLHQYWSFSFSISPSNEHPGVISFRMDWLDLLAVQGTLKRLLKHHSLKASILRHSAFFIAQLSHPYMTIGKTIDLTRLLCWQSNVSAF